MLTVMRSRAGGIVAKAFIGLLAASFAVWGISDVFRGSRTDTLVTVGDTEITTGQFQQTFRNQLNRLSRQLGKPVTPDEARQMGIDSQVLARLIQNAALDEEIRRLKIALPDKYIASRVAQMKEFQGLTGTFDREKFHRMLASIGISEARFLREEKGAILRAGMISAVVAGFSAPETLVRVLHEHRNAMRDVALFRVSAKGIAVPEPTEEELKRFHDSNRNLFALPERRQLFVVTALPADLKAGIRVSDEEIRDYYNSHKSDFGMDEQREVEQIVFANEEEAKAAAEKIRTGKATWEDIAKEKGLSASDRRLGLFTKKSYPDQQTAGTIFALKEGEVSPPLKGMLSISLAKVTKIIPGHTRKLAEVREKIRDILKLEKAKDLALEIHDKVEDARASGQSLEDIAKSLGLKTLSTPWLSADGVDEKGAKTPLPMAPDLLKAAFESDVGVDNDAIATNDDGFIWFDVRDIRPASIEPLEKVREKAVKLWKEKKRRELVMEKARALKKRAEAGEDFAKLAAEAGAEVRTLKKLKRNDAREDFPVAATRALFAAPENGYAVARGSDGVSALVMKSSPVPTPPLDEKSAEARSIRQVLAQSGGEDISALFLAALQKEFGVKINRRLWARITGENTQ